MKKLILLIIVLLVFPMIVKAKNCTLDIKNSTMDCTLHNAATKYCAGLIVLPGGMYIGDYLGAGTNIWDSYWSFNLTNTSQGCSIPNSAEILSAELSVYADETNLNVVTIQYGAMNVFDLTDINSSSVATIEGWTFHSGSKTGSWPAGVLNTRYSVDVTDSVQTHVNHASYGDGSSIIIGAREATSAHHRSTYDYGINSDRSVRLIIEYVDSKPTIDFATPVPDDYNTTPKTSVNINVSIENVGTMQNVTWEWDEKNYSFYGVNLTYMSDLDVTTQDVSLVGGKAVDTSTGLDGLWRFASGWLAASFPDDSRNSYDAAKVGGTSQVTGKWDSAIDLDGTGDYANVGDLDTVSQLKFSNSGFSIVAYGDTDGGNNNVYNIMYIVGAIDDNNGGGTKEGYGIYCVIQAYCVFVIGDGSNWYNSGRVNVPISTGWHMLAGVYNVSHICLYADGLDYKNCTAHSFTYDPGEEDFVIGATDTSYDAARQAWNGTIDEVHAFDRPLYEGEIEYLYNKQTFSDSSGLLYIQGRHESGMWGRLGQAFNLTTEKHFDNNSGTLEMWVIPLSNSTTKKSGWHQYLVDARTGYQWNFLIYYHTGNKNLYYYVYNGTTAGKPARIYNYTNYNGLMNDSLWKIGEPSHITITWDETGYNALYVNGLLIDDAPAGSGAGRMAPKAGGIMFGSLRNPYSNHASDCVFDEIRIYNHSLTHEGVREHYKTQLRWRNNLTWVLESNQSNLTYYGDYNYRACASNSYGENCTEIRYLNDVCYPIGGYPWVVNKLCIIQNRIIKDVQDTLLTSTETTYGAIQIENTNVTTWRINVTNSSPRMLISLNGTSILNTTRGYS